MEGLLKKDSKKNYKDFTRPLFMNSCNGQMSITLSKKDMKEFYGANNPIPKKLKFRLWKGV